MPVGDHMGNWKLRSTSVPALVVMLENPGRRRGARGVGGMDYGANARGCPGSYIQVLILGE